MRYLLAIMVLALMGCNMQTPGYMNTASQQGVPQTVPPAGPKLSPQQAARNFTAVVAKMEPVVEQQCRAMTTGLNCDFDIVVDDRPGKAPNAFQTLRGNRPVLGFTRALINDMRNQHELAFVLGHEAAHHMHQHLAKRKNTAVAGALIFGIVAAGLGGDASVVDAAADVGGAVGARTYSKDHELEADSLGAKLTVTAGYDPVKGVAYFMRSPDPGNKFLGTHPANGSRIATVQASVGK